MKINVRLGNYDRYAAQQYLIKGVGKTADTLVLEMTVPFTEYLNIPRFDPSNKYHKELALISIEAHEGLCAVYQAREKISELITSIGNENFAHNT